MRRRARAVRVSRAELRAVRAMLRIRFLQLFSNKREKVEADHSGRARTKQLILFSLLASSDVRRRPRYSSLKAETGFDSREAPVPQTLWGGRCSLTRTDQHFSDRTRIFLAVAKLAREFRRSPAPLRAPARLHQDARNRATRSGSSCIRK